MPATEQRHHYTNRARELRKLADAASYPDIGEILEAIAKSYDKLAREAEGSGARSLYPD